MKGLRLAGTVFRIDAGEASAKLAGELVGFGKAEGTALDLTVASDPIATLAAQGGLVNPFEVTFDAQAVLDGDGIRPVVADGAIWHEAGASEVEELAAVTAALAEYLRLFDRRGVPPARALQRIAVTLAADADQFATIAKMRAARLLQARLTEAIGAPAMRLPLHAATSWRMLSRLDPHTNILRTTSAVLGAGIGGADSVTALPFDAATSGDDQFARRIARNCQTILIDESELAVVSDPGAGSGAVEALTDHLARNGWDLFRTIEREGGLLAAVRSGTMQRRIAETRDRRIDGVRRGRIEIVGTNAFPDGAERGLRLASKGPAAQPVNGAAETVEALCFLRPAEPFEMLRDRAQAMGGPQRVLLVMLGNGASDAATRAAAIFGIAGIPSEIVTGVPSSPLAARVACLCVQGKATSTEIADAAMRLRGLGAAKVYLAGSKVAAMSGIDGALADGIDLVEFLGGALDAAGGR
jgi:methylmalonyl-CoA mutase